MTPSLVLIHGFLGHAGSYAGVRQALSTLRFAQSPLCPLLSGHHGSNAPAAARSPTYEEEVSRLASLVRGANLAPATVVGYSMGARLALSLAIRHPGLVRSLILVSGRRGLDSAEQRQARLRADEQWALLLEHEGMNGFLEQWTAQPLFASLRSLPASILEADREARRQHEPCGLAAALRELGLGRMPSHQQEVSTLSMPVTLMAGGLDHRFVDLGEQLAGEVPDGQLSVVDGAGHNLLLEAPMAVARTIRENLRL